MESLRWHSMVAAAIILFFASPLKAQNPLEQLEAKLLEQEKLEATKLDDRKQPPSESPSEKLPGSKNKSVKSLLVDPPYLGMTLERPSGGGLGLRVVEVVDQSPAWKSGFRIDDRVLAIAGTAVADIDAFAGEIAKSAPNELVKFLVERRGRQMDINVVLIPRSVASKTLPNAIMPGGSPATGAASPAPPRTNPMQPRVPQAMDGQGSLGLVLAPLSDAFRRQFGIPVFRGASVLEITPNSPGFLAGLSPGDCIVDIDGMSILNDEDVVKWKQTAPAKASYSLGFYRGAQLMQTTIQAPLSNREPIQVGRSNSNASDVTADMLTPEYIQRLQSELAELRQELGRSQDRIQSLENAINKAR